jgi:hypothetical protein
MLLRMRLYSQAIANDASCARAAGQREFISCGQSVAHVCKDEKAQSQIDTI